MHGCQPAEASPSPCREVDKVLAGLEILSKVFDQQSSPMVSKILQQVRASGMERRCPYGAGSDPTVGCVGMD